MPRRTTAAAPLGQPALRRPPASAPGRAELLQALIERSPDGIVITDDAGVCVYANAAATGLFGMADLVGSSVRDFTDRAFDAEAAWQTFKAAGTAAGDLTIRRPQGDTRVLAYSAVAGVLPGRHLAVLRDATRQRRAEQRRRLRLAAAEARRRRAEAAREAAEAASRARDEVLAVLAHELRNTVTNVLGAARILRAAAPASEQRERALETIERNAELEVRLVSDLLDAARLVRSAMTFDFSPVDVAAVVSLAIESVRPAAEAKRIGLDWAVDALRPAVKGDGERLRQVFVNLLANAIAFTPPEGRVTVRMDARGPWISVSVADTGTGIPAPLLPRIFDRFVRAAAATGAGRASSGLGLGLAIVKHIVEAHGGRVQATSEGPGRGSTFLVSLPVSC